MNTWPLKLWTSHKITPIKGGYGKEKKLEDKVMTIKMVTMMMLIVVVTFVRTDNGCDGE